MSTSVPMTSSGDSGDISTPGEQTTTSLAITSTSVQVSNQEWLFGGIGILIGILATLIIIGILLLCYRHRKNHDSLGRESSPKPGNNPGIPADICHSESELVIDNPYAGTNRQARNDSNNIVSIKKNGDVIKEDLKQTEVTASTCRSEVRSITSGGRRSCTSQSSISSSSLHVDVIPEIPLSSLLDEIHPADRDDKNFHDEDETIPPPSEEMTYESHSANGDDNNLHGEDEMIPPPREEEMNYPSLGEEDKNLSLAFGKMNPYKDESNERDDLHDEDDNFPPPPTIPGRQYSQKSSQSSVHDGDEIAMMSIGKSPDVMSNTSSTIDLTSDETVQRTVL